MMDNDFDNFIIACILCLLLGWVGHSRTAHYLPDDWDFWVELRRVSEKVEYGIKKYSNCFC